MNNLLFRSLLATAALLAAAALDGQTASTTVSPPPAPRPRLSPHETVNVTIGERGTPTRIWITYGRPYSKKGGTGETRKIWGGLVPWGKADRLGADEATLLITQKPLEIAGTLIPAGAYALYIFPSESGPSKLAFSSNFMKWGIPVDETKDIARFDLKKDTLDRSVDQLTIALVKDAAPGSGRIIIAWETTQFYLPFAMKM